MVEPGNGNGRAVLGHLAAAGYEVGLVGGGREGLDGAARWQPDVVVVDVGAADADALDLARRLRVDPRTRTAGVVALTSPGMTVEQLREVAACVHDHLSDPFDSRELLVRVEAVVGRGRSARELSPLTGLPGRFQLDAELERLTARPEPRFALLAVDLDRFGAYNERYGYARGDEVIRATARLVTNGQAHHRLHPTFAAHLGADDFAVVTAPERAEALARWLVGSFDRAVPSHYDEADRLRGFIEVLDRRAEPHRHHLMTLSVGVVTTERRRLPSRCQALALAWEMREVARRDATSSYAIDRRGDPSPAGPAPVS